MIAEEQLLLFHRLFHGKLVNNIFLCTILNTNISESKSNILVHYHALCISSSIHNIDFCDNTDSSNSLRIKIACHLQTVRGCHISICWHNTKNNCARVTTISMTHSSCYLLNICILSSNRNFGDTWQIDQSQIRTGWRKNVENNRLVNDIFCFTTDFISQLFNRNSDFLKVCELLAWNFFRENSPRLGSIRCVIKSQLKWSSSYDSITSR